MHILGENHVQKVTCIPIFTKALFTIAKTWKQPKCPDREINKDDVVQIFNRIFSPFSCSVVYNSLRPHGLQHARPPYPSPTPGVYSNSCPLSRWSIQPSHLLSSPSPPAFNLSQHQGLFKWVSSVSGGQSIGVSASTSVLPMNIQDWFSLGSTGWISLQSVPPFKECCF